MTGPQNLDNKRDVWTITRSQDAGVARAGEAVQDSDSSWATQDQMTPHQLQAKMLTAPCPVPHARILSLTIRGGVKMLVGCRAVPEPIHSNKCDGVSGMRGGHSWAETLLRDMQWGSGAGSERRSEREPRALHVDY